MSKGDRFWAIEEAKERVRKADAAGEVVDSMEVRRALMARVSSGEITLERAQEELKKIKRTGRTRNDAFLGKS